MPHTQRVAEIVEAVERRSGLGECFDASSSTISTRRRVVEDDEGKLIAISIGTDIVGR